MKTRNAFNMVDWPIILIRNLEYMDGSNSLTACIRDCMLSPSPPTQRKMFHKVICWPAFRRLGTPTSDARDQGKALELI